MGGSYTASRLTQAVNPHRSKLNGKRDMGVWASRHGQPSVGIWSCRWQRRPPLLLLVPLNHEYLLTAGK